VNAIATRQAQQTSDNDGTDEKLRQRASEVIQSQMVSQLLSNITAQGQTSSASSLLDGSNDNDETQNSVSLTERWYAEA
jgi:hypothetical protein